MERRHRAALVHKHHQVCLIVQSPPVHRRQEETLACHTFDRGRDIQNILRTMGCWAAQIAPSVNHSSTRDGPIPFQPRRFFRLGRMNGARTGKGDRLGNAGAVTSRRLAGGCSVISDFFGEQARRAEGVA